MAVSWGKHQQAELHTIPFSQYSEIARWSMQLAGEDFEEKSYLPTHHLTSLTSSRRKRTRLGASSRRCDDSPCYVAPDGERLDDCWQILERFMGEVPADLVELLSCEVGPQVAALFQHFILAPEMADAWRSVGVAAPVKWWQRRLWGIASSRIGAAMRGCVAKDAAFVVSAQKSLDEALSKLERLLLQPGNPFTPQEDGRPSPAGLALASLLAPLVDVEDYTCGRCNIVRMAGGLGAFPQPFQKLVEECQSRPVGKFVLETYKERMNFRTESTTESSPDDDFDLSPYPGLF